MSLKKKEVKQEPEIYYTDKFLKGSSNSRGFYLPVFQRQFAWDKSNIDMFIDNILNGVRVVSSAKNENEARFNRVMYMGTVVCHEDGNPTTLYEQSKSSERPGEILVVIDGQQRISVCLLVAIALHNHLSMNREIISNCKKVKSEDFNKVNDETAKELYKLLASSEIPLEECKTDYYPRIIRQVDDKWANRKPYSKYNSPISSIIENYIEANKTKKYDYSEQKKLTRQQYYIADKYSYISKRIYDIMTNKIPDYPSARDICNNMLLLEKIFGMKAASNENNFLNEYRIIEKQLEKDILGISDKLKNDIENKQKTEFKEKINEYNSVLKEVILAKKACEENVKLILFSNYFLHNLSFVKVLTDDYEHANRIFRSINTTGDPLTAFETFYPIVSSKFESVEEFVNIDGMNDCMPKLHKTLEEVNNCFILDTKFQETLTRKTLTTFILSETGKGSISDKRDQDEELEKSFDHDFNNSKQLGGARFVTHMLATARVHSAYYKYDSQSDITNNAFIQCLEGKFKNYSTGYDETVKPKNKNIRKQLSNEALFCFQLLSACGHRIALAIISRFYFEFLNACGSNDDKIIDKSHEILCKVIRSTTAFWILWRIGKPDTKGIDKHHRHFFSSMGYARGLSNSVTPDYRQIVNKYKELLFGIEEDNEKEVFPTSEHMESWINSSSVRDVYNNNITYVAMFIIILDAYKGKTYPQTSLTYDLWDYEGYETIEHILPQKSRNIEVIDGETKNTLGNLTLLPTTINSIISNNELVDCIRIYKFLIDGVESKVLDPVERNEIVTNIIKKTVVKQRISKEKPIEEWNAIFEKIEKYIQEEGIVILPSIKAIIDIFEENNKFGSEEVICRGKEILSNVWPILVDDWLSAD